MNNTDTAAYAVTGRHEGNKAKRQPCGVRRAAGHYLSILVIRMI